MTEIEDIYYLGDAPTSDGGLRMARKLDLELNDLRRFVSSLTTSADLFAKENAHLLIKKHEIEGSW